MAAPVHAARRYTIAFANLTEEPGVRLEGLGFFGKDVRRSFELAARTPPVDMVFFDNGGEAAKAIANADAAIAQKVDLFIGYCADPDANAEIGRKLQTAGIPALAINYSIPGAPLYAADNFAAGRLAGVTLGQFAKRDWADEAVVAVIAGDLGDPGAAVAERLRGIAEGLAQDMPAAKPALLDTTGQPVRIEALLKKFIATLGKQKIVMATLDDPTALAARQALDLLARANDCVIVAQGLDRTLHGGSSEKKEIDPGNRNSPVLGSIAYFMDRYGYEALPLALKILGGESVPARTTTRHVLVGAANIFAIYPPFDMN